MAFNIGDKILCVDERVKPESISEIAKDFQSWVTKGKEYTIRDILYNDNIVTGVVLQEIYNIPIFIRLINRVQEPAFGTFRFVKSQSKSMSVETKETKKQLV